MNREPHTPHFAVRASTLEVGQASRLHRTRSANDWIVKAVIEGHEFEDGLPPAVAALLALPAARAFPEAQRLVRGRLQFEFSEDRRRVFDRTLAVGTYRAHQPLGQHCHQAGGEQVRLDPHVDQPRDGARGVVGVQG